MQLTRSLSVAAVALFAVAVLLVPSTALAEHHEGEEHSHDDMPLYRIIHFDQVHPSKMMEHEENSRQWVKAFRDAGMGEDWTWWASAGPQFTYVYVFPFRSYADLDLQDARNKEMAEALGEEKMNELVAGASTVRSHYSEIVKFEPELSYHAPPMGPPGFLRVGVHWVEPSQDEPYRALMKKAAEAYAKTEQTGSFEVHKVAYGQGSYAIVTTAANAAAFYERPQIVEILTEAYGQEEAGKMLEEWLSYVNNYDTENYTIRADMSFIPAMYEAEAANGEAGMIKDDAEGE